MRSNLPIADNTLQFYEAKLYNKNIINVPNAMKQSTHKAAISLINTAKSNNKYIPSTMNKNYKYVAKSTKILYKIIKG